MNEPKPTDQSLAGLRVPGWLTVMILSPLMGMVVHLWLDSASPAGLAVAVVGSAAGAMLAKGNARVRLLRGLGGAAFGLGGFLLAFAGAIGMSILAKGL